MPGMHVISKPPPLCLFNYVHSNLKRTILALLRVERLVTFLFDVDGLAIFCKAVNGDYDYILLLDQALAVASLTFLLDEVAVAFASIADLLSSEHRILFHTSTLT